MRCNDDWSSGRCPCPAHSLWGPLTARAAPLTDGAGGALAPVCWEGHTRVWGCPRPAPCAAWSWAAGAARSRACCLFPGKDLRGGCCLVTRPAGTESHICLQAAAKLQETERTLRDQEGVLKALTLERDQAVQALRTRGLLPEEEVQVSATAWAPPGAQQLLEPSSAVAVGEEGHTDPNGRSVFSALFLSCVCRRHEANLAPGRAEVSLCSDTSVSL